MSLLSRWSKSQPTPSTQTAYLTEDIDAAEAAATLGVSAARWRQIAGTRANPNPVLPPDNKAGERGARWKLRHVLDYAAAQDRDLRQPLPPLLPLSGGPRYMPTGPSTGARPGYELSLPIGTDSSAVWAQLFIPTQTRRCGHPEQCLLLLTPLWPADAYQVGRDVPQYLLQAAARPGWGDALRAHPAGVSVVILNDEPSAWFVRAVLLDAQDLTTALSPTLAAMSESYGLSPDPQNFPAQDVATCLGWPALPWWPKGTATRSLCARWNPGAPVTTNIPEALRARERVTHWLLRQVPRIPATQSDFDEAARMYDPARQEGLHALIAKQHGLQPQAAGQVPEGYELAVTLRWDPASPSVTGADAQPSRALDQVMTTPHVPAEITTVLHHWLGDPTYTAPVYLPRDLLPTDWWDLVDQSRRVLPVAEDERTTPRWQRMISTHLRESADHNPDYDQDETSLDLGLIGPLNAPIILDAQGITIAAPTGYQPSASSWKDEPARALARRDDMERDQVRDVLLLTSPSGEVRGLYRTEYDDLAPMPAKGSWMTGLNGQAAVMVAACLDLATEDVIDLRNRAETSGDEPMEQLLRSAHTPLVISWPDLCHDAQLTLADYKAKRRRAVAGDGLS